MDVSVSVSGGPDEDARSTYFVQANKGLDLRGTISRLVVSNGWNLLTIQLVSMSLEEIFLKLTTNEELGE